MPPKRRQNQPQAAVQSDYDTETATYANDIAVPNRTIEQLNFSVLSKYVPGLRRIISIAPFTVVYVFSPDSSQWEKSGIEGSLFLCELTDGDRLGYTVVILNRKSLDNFVLPLTTADAVELTDEYIILQDVKDDGTPRVYGLWVFSEAGAALSTKEQLGMAIQECALRAEPLDTNDGEQSFNEPEYHQPEHHDRPDALDRTVYETTPAPQAIDLATLFAKPQNTEQRHVEPYAVQQQDNALPTGQRIDLGQLFSRPPAQPEERVQPLAPSHHHYMEAARMAQSQQQHQQQQHWQAQHPQQPTIPQHALASHQQPFQQHQAPQHHRAPLPQHYAAPQQQALPPHYAPPPQHALPPQYAPAPQHAPPPQLAPPSQQTMLLNLLKSGNNG